jgi:hypothetical protein
MNFFRSMEIDPTCQFSPPQSRSGGISFYGFSAPRRFHATKIHTAHDAGRLITCIIFPLRSDKHSAGKLRNELARTSLSVTSGDPALLNQALTHDQARGFLSGRHSPATQPMDAVEDRRRVSAPAAEAGGVSYVATSSVSGLRRCA